jgi:hypothetical protein
MIATPLGRRRSRLVGLEVDGGVDPAKVNGPGRLLLDLSGLEGIAGRCATGVNAREARPRTGLKGAIVGEEALPSGRFLSGAPQTRSSLKRKEQTARLRFFPGHTLLFVATYLLQKAARTLGA